MGVRPWCWWWAAGRRGGEEGKEKEKKGDRDGNGEARARGRRKAEKRNGYKKRETEDVGLGGWRLAATLDVRRVRNYRFSERLARRAARRLRESWGPSLVTRSLTGVPTTSDTKDIARGPRSLLRKMWRGARFVKTTTTATVGRWKRVLRSTWNSNYSAALCSARWKAGTKSWDFYFPRLPRLQAASSAMMGSCGVDFGWSRGPGCWVTRHCWWFGGLQGGIWMVCWEREH